MLGDVQKWTAKLLQVTASEAHGLVLWLCCLGSRQVHHDRLGAIGDGDQKQASGPQVTPQQVADTASYRP